MAPQNAQETMEETNGVAKKEKPEKPNIEQETEAPKNTAEQDAEERKRRWRLVAHALISLVSSTNGILPTELIFPSPPPTGLSSQITPSIMEDIWGVELARSGMIIGVLQKFMKEFEGIFDQIRAQSIDCVVPVEVATAHEFDKSTDVVYAVLETIIEMNNDIQASQNGH